MKNQITIIATTIIVSALTVLGISLFGLPRINTQNGAIVTKDPTQQIIQERIEEYKKTSNLESDITKAIEQVSPTVVSIIATKDLEYYLQDPVSFFLGNRPEVTPSNKTTVKVGGGSGIIVSKDGYIITNKHVITDVHANYTVITTDGDQYTVKNIRLDPILDIAVLQIVDTNNKVPSSLIPASFISVNSPVRVGQFVVAIGNALSEYTNTATFGIISAKNRVLDDQTGASYIGLYQTDSSINPGNSGGPLIATNGEIIGMNTAVAQGEGLGFSLPMTNEFVQTTLASITTGDVKTIRRPYIGIESSMLSKTTAKALNLSKFDGIYITTVQKDSPAAQAGLLSGDIITSINNNNVQTDMPLLYTLYTYKPGDILTLLIYRNKDYQKINITLGSLKTQ